MFAKLRLLLRISHSQDILRRYFVVNGFDGALTMLGLNMGFYLSGNVDVGVSIAACLGAAIALGMSGLTSAYISEVAERQRWLQDLEDAMVVGDLHDSAHNAAAKVIPVLVAVVNGLAPLLISLFIMTPLWLVQANVALPVSPAAGAVIFSFVAIFGLGIFLGKVRNIFWLWSGLQTVFIAAVTALVIFLV